MVAFEPCLATVGVAGDGSGNTTIYIPYHTYTIPSCRPCRKSAAQVHLPSTDDLNKAIRESLYCFGVLANAASASLILQPLQAALLQQQ